jgi:hypothetical protein
MNNEHHGSTWGRMARVPMWSANTLLEKKKNVWMIGGNKLKGGRLQSKKLGKDKFLTNQSCLTVGFNYNDGSGGSDIVLFWPQGQSTHIRKETTVNIQHQENLVI